MAWVLLVVSVSCSGGGGGGGSGGGSGPAASTPQSALSEPESFAMDPIAGPSSSGLSSSPHPNLILNQNEIDGMLGAILLGEQPITSQFNTARQAATLQSPPNPDVPSTVYQGTNHKAFRSNFDPDTRAALFSAITTRFPALITTAERELLLENVRDYLVAWARHSLQVSSINEICASNECLRFETPLSISVGLVYYIAAYDLIFDEAVLSETDHAEIRTWLERLYSLLREGTFIWGGGPAAGGPALCHRYSNHASHHIAAMAAIGYILEDAAKIEESLEGSQLEYNWSTLLRDQIYIEGQPVIGCDAGNGLPVFTGQIYDRYRHFDVPGIVNDPNGDPNLWNDSNRSYGYSQISLLNLSFVAEMALHRGRDLYRAKAQTGESLDLAGQYLAYFKSVFGHGRLVLTPTGYPGEASYTGEILNDGHNGTFELLASRYHQDADITRALEPYDLLGINRSFFDVRFFGRYYDALRLAWNFHIDDISEGWEMIDAAQFDASGVAGGKLFFSSVGKDPAIHISDLFLAAERYRTLVLRMRVSNPSLHVVDLTSEFHWQTEAGQSGGVAFAYVADGNVREYRIALAGFPTWNSPGNRVVELRLDPVSDSGLDVEIESIVLDVN